MRFRVNSKCLTLAVLLSLAAPYSLVYAVPVPPGSSDAGVQLNKTREYLEKQRVAQELEEGKEKKPSKVEDKTQYEQKEEAEGPKFLANEIVTEKSEVLKNEEISSITGQYVGKQISIKDLYAAVNAINKVYEQKGYITCRAFLPAQTIKKGVVHIRLVEGRTGNIVVNGNDSTDSSYITNRMHLAAEKIENVHVLNDDLLLFNATNDVQLRISLQAGEKPGTTDYIISAFEPQRRSITAYADNAGYESSGLYREGLFYLDRSLTGNRDALNISTIYSEGTKSVSTYYTRPIGRSGTKLTAQYSTNSVHVIDGELEEMRVQGHSNAYGMSLVQPLKVTEKCKTEASFEYSHQNSKTDFHGIHWVDDKIDDYTAAFSMTNYGKSHILWQKHGYRVGRWENIDGAQRDFGKYQMNAFYQKAYAHGQLISAGANGQWSSNNYLPSAEQFYIGGVYSVRGYEESIMSGDHGYSFNLEYSVPTSKATSVFTFLDYGSVHGDSAFDDHVLMGTGVGLKSKVTDKIYTNVSLGVPLRRDFNGTEVSKTRLHFMLSGQF